MAPEQSGDRARRELTAAVGLCLLGAALALLAGSRTWLSGVVEAAPPLPARPLRLTGGELVEVRPLALLGLAAVPALAATKRWGRVLVGVVTLLAGAGVVALTAEVLADPTADPAAREATRSAVTGWPWACAAGGLLLALAGLLVAVRGRRWAAMSARYDAPAARAEQPVPSAAAPAQGMAGAGPAAAPSERALWEALDRGEDPTGS